MITCYLTTFIAPGGSALLDELGFGAPWISEEGSTFVKQNNP